MNTLSIITVLFFTISCNQNISTEKKPLNVIKVNQQEQSKIDSVFVDYWKGTEANEYQFYYSNKILEIKSEYLGLRKRIDNKQSIQAFLEYINLFYLDKEKEIILNRTKSEYLESTDYSNIKVKGYKKKKEIFNESTQIGEEKYDIEFNPKFLEFYEFLDNLVKRK